MKVEELITTLKQLVNEPTVYYSVSGGKWCGWNGDSWNMDCVCMIKGILWGFNFNKDAAHGGAIYLSNGVYDDGPDKIMSRCSETSEDFSVIEPGEIVHMNGHVGIYIGDRKVIEATAAWDRKVQISDIGTDGFRSKDGRSGGFWKNHGKLIYVEYPEKPMPEKTIDELAREVIAGLWGNGQERKERLEAAGYDYRTIQDRVNEMLAPDPGKIVVGCNVHLITPVDYNGRRLASWVTDKVFTVLEMNYDRVVIGLNGAVTAAVNIANLVRM